MSGPTALRRWILVAAVALVALVAFVVGTVPGAQAAALPKVTKASEIDMSFSDSSTPPQYHRSWTGHVRNGIFAITVDAYGTVVAKGSFKVPVATWARVNVLLPKVKSAKSGGSTAGCAGGTGRTLEVRVAKKVVVSLDTELCGGPNPQAEATDAVNNEFLKLVGDFDTFAKRGQPPKAIT